MNKVIKILLKIIMIVLLYTSIYIPKVDALGSLSEIFSSADSFLDEGKKSDTGEDKVLNLTEVKELNNDVYNILFTIGVALSVIIGAILGCQLMLGSVETQVKAKEMLVPYVIGCIVIFGAFGIWKIVMMIMTNVTGESLFI